MRHSLRYLVNCSIMFTELPLLERPAAAKAAGFNAIEFWWPFAQAVPDQTEVDKFVCAINDAGVHLVGLNLFAGDLVGPDCGVLSIPARSKEFAGNLDIAIGIGELLGTNVFNALYGNRVEDVDAAEQDELAIHNIALAATAAAKIDATVLIESISGPKPYPLRTAADAVQVVEKSRAAGAANVAVLFDLFHLASNGDDIVAAIDAYLPFIEHVQIADAPGRGEPGTGTIDIGANLEYLESAGYGGWVSIEYLPTLTTAESLHWLPISRRSG